MKSPATRPGINKGTLSSLMLVMGILAVSTTGRAAISWVDTPLGAYTAGPVLSTVANAVSRPQFEGIGIEFSADQDGNEFRANDRQIIFRNTNPLALGDSITFNFDFNMQLFSGPNSAFDPSLAGNTRAAALFRLNTPVVDVTGALTPTGGTDTIQGFFSSGPNPAPTTGATSHSNPSGLEWNTGNGGTATDYSVFGSFLSGGTTATFTENPADLSQLNIPLYDRGRSTADFSFSGWEFTVTNNSATPIPANSAFLFTFEGHNPAGQLAAIASAVPEPSRLLLLAAGGVGIALRTRRRRPR